MVAALRIERDGVAGLTNVTDKICDLRVREEKRQVDLMILSWSNHKQGCACGIYLLVLRKCSCINLLQTVASSYIPAAGAMP